MRTTSPSRAPARAQRAFDAHAAQLLLHVRERIGSGESASATARSAGRPVDAPLVAFLRARPSSPAPAGRSTTYGSGSPSAARALRRPAARLRRANSSRPVRVDRRDRESVEARRRDVFGRDVGLAADDDARPVEQLGPVPAELVEQDALPARRACGRRPARGRTASTSTRARSMWRRNW